jgi:hypothetical protein
MPRLLKRNHFLLFCLCMMFEPVQAQKDYHIVFYNVENLYDVRNDPAIYDEAFTPYGENHWTTKRFNRKILLIYKAIMACCKGQFPDLIGLAEIENNRVVEQLITQTPLSKIQYGIIHKESPDPRGIDVALLYRKDRIMAVDYEHIKVASSDKKGFTSRDILHFTGDADGNRLHLFINHWPSRSGGYNETKENRNITARLLRFRIDSLLKFEPYARILILGDFNATPKEECIVDILNAHPYTGLKVNNSLVNLSSAWLNCNWGTVKRNGKWEIFDQIICSSNMLDSSEVQIVPSKTEICRASFLLEADKRYLSKKPYRTYLGPVYHGGISDHLPIVTVLSTSK